jgi:hypothetical protein
MKARILVIVIIGFALLGGLASASKPGDMIPLRLNSYQLQTSGLIITPSWKPAYIKWYLVDPSGNVKYMVQSNLDSVSQISSGLNTATWSISENSGIIKIPAFAEHGDWIIKGKIYDTNKVFIIQWSNKAEFVQQTIPVGEYSIFDNLMAPTSYVYINLGGNMLTGDLEFSFAIPDLIYIIAGIIIILLIVINVKAFRDRRKIYG